MWAESVGFVVPVHASTLGVFSKLPMQVTGPVQVPSLSSSLAVWS